jgi:DNA-binding transcriptional MerR regulator
MEDNSGHLLTIGQFARMCWLSVKALRLYDQSGLLNPAHVDPTTHYRYYTAAQAPVARAIAILRGLDMPLSQIEEIVTTGDPNKVRKHLDTHRSLLARRIERDRYLLDRVENFIKKGVVVTYDMKLTDVEPVEVIGLTFKAAPEELNEEGGKAMGQLAAGLHTAGIDPAGPPRWVYRSMDDDSWTIEACFPISGVESAPVGFTLHRLDGGRAATALHVGPYDELGMAYRELEVWIEKQGLVATGPTFDVYLNDPNEVSSPAELETQIFWPVK